MKKALFIIILPLLLGTNLLFAQANTDNQTLEEKIDAYLTQGVSNGFSGSVLIAKAGEVILEKGYGMANKESEIPYTPATISTIGSVTKQFTATAILKLEELDQLKVTDPISIYFNDLPADKKGITIHQLLTHSSGLVDVIGGDFDDIPRDQFFRTVFATELLHEPGTKYHYSNVGYSILARIIEIASGQPYELFLNKQLFQAAGMMQTGYFMPQWDKNLIANGYARNVFDMGTMIARYNKVGHISWNLKGNGGIHSTTGDMFKWYLALNSNKILSAESFEKLTTPYILEYEGYESHYAYGWAIYSSESNTKIISHNGGNSIFFHDFIWRPEEDVLIILFTNAASREVEVAWRIEKMLFDEGYEAPAIRKNLLYLVFDFMEKNDVNRSIDLITTIKEEYRSTIKNSDYLNEIGYEILRSNKDAGWTIALFQLNTELYPDEGNLWDSLGEAYLKNGQIEEATRSYETALELAPDKDCHWCENATQVLEQLK